MFLILKAKDVGEAKNTTQRNKHLYEDYRNGTLVLQ